MDYDDKVFTNLDKIYKESYYYVFIVYFQIEI